MSKDNKEDSMRFSFEEVFAEERGICPHAEELLLYFQNRLSGMDREQFKNHLRECSLCAQQLLELQEVERIAETTALDEREAERVFERDRRALQTYLEEKYGKTEPMRKGGFLAFLSGLFGALSLPAYANAALVALLMILIYPAYKSFILNDQLARVQNELAAEKSTRQAQVQALDAEKKAYEQQIRRLSEGSRQSIAPTLSRSAVQTVKPERSAKAETIEVRFNGRASFNLVFAAHALEFKTYVVEISQNQSVLWRDEIQLPPDKSAPSDLISITLHRDYFPAGEYHLAIYGKRGERTTLLEEYNLRIK